MSEAKWTPGPWVFHANARLIAVAPELYSLLDEFPGFAASLQEKAAWAQRVIDTKRKARGE